MVNAVAGQGGRTPVRSLSVGVGARRGVTADEVCAAVADVLRAAGSAPEAVARLATVAVRAAEPGLFEAARLLGARLCAYSPGTLTAVEVPNPSPVAQRSAGTPSVAEAAALLAAGAGARLLVAKAKPASTGRPARVTVAVAHARRPAPPRPVLRPSARPWATNPSRR